MCVTSLCTRGALDTWSRGRSTAALGAVIKFIALIAVAAPVLVAAYVLWLGSRYDNAYEAASLGLATEANVRDVAGDPSYITDGTRWVEPAYAKTADELVPGCVKELWYAMPWPLPHRTSFCFDRNGVLIHKYNWVSW